MFSQSNESLCNWVQTFENALALGRNFSKIDQIPFFLISYRFQVSVPPLWLLLFYYDGSSIPIKHYLDQSLTHCQESLAFSNFDAPCCAFRSFSFHSHFSCTVDIVTDNHIQVSSSLFLRVSYEMRLLQRFDIPYLFQIFNHDQHIIFGVKIGSRCCFLSRYFTRTKVFITHLLHLYQTRYLYYVMNLCYQNVGT